MFFTNNLIPKPRNLGEQEIGPKDPSKRQRVEVNLNSFQADSELRLGSGLKGPGYQGLRVWGSKAGSGLVVKGSLQGFLRRL